MIVTVWNNGRHHESGAGYGIKIRVEDRDCFFNSTWKTVILELEGYSYPVEVNIDKPSFWNISCRELIAKDIGVWLQQSGLAPWPKGEPPKLEMAFMKDNRFQVSGAQR